MRAQGIVVQRECDFPLARPAAPHGGASPRRARAHAPISGARAQAKRTCGCWVTGVGVVAPGCFFRHVRARSEVEAFAFVDGMGFEVRRLSTPRPAGVGRPRARSL